MPEAAAAQPGAPRVRLNVTASCLHPPDTGLMTVDLPLMQLLEVRQQQLHPPNKQLTTAQIACDMVAVARAPAVQ